MRVHRPARRQRASTRTWPPGAVAWSELVIWRCSLVFRLVIAAMTLHHHTGDVVSTDSSPKDAFLLSRLTIREPSQHPNPDPVARRNSRRKSTWINLPA